MRERKSGRCVPGEHGALCLPAAGSKHGVQALPVGRPSTWCTRQIAEQQWNAKTRHVMTIHRRHTGEQGENEMSLLHYVEHTAKSFISWLGENEWQTRCQHGFTVLHAICQSEKLCESSTALISDVVSASKAQLSVATKIDKDIAVHLLSSNTRCAKAPLALLFGKSSTAPTSARKRKPTKVVHF